MPAADPVPSPALSQIVTTPGPITGRVIGVIASAGPISGITKLRRAVEAQGPVLRLLAPSGGTIKRARSTQPVDRTFPHHPLDRVRRHSRCRGQPNADRRQADGPTRGDLRHGKVIGAWGDGDQILTAAGIDTTAPGVVLAEAVAKPYTTELFAAVGLHRAWDRIH